MENNERLTETGVTRMKWFIRHVLLFIIGLAVLATVIIYEIDGTLGFILATLGATFMFIGLTLRGLIYLILNLL